MATPASIDASALRTSTGSRALDLLIDGGFPAQRAVAVCGGPGTGKTALALRFIADGLDRGETAAYIAVDEKPRHILEDAARLGLDLEPAAARGTLALLDASPYFTATRKSRTRADIDARQVAADVTRQVREINARRLVIDSMTSLVPPTLVRGEVFDYLRSLIHSVEDNLGCTTLLTCRGTRTDPQASCDAVRHLVSGVIQLKLRRQGRGLTRTLSIRKMRGARIDPAEYVFSIEAGCGLLLAGRADLLPSNV